MSRKALFLTTLLLVGLIAIIYWQRQQQAPHTSRPTAAWLKPLPEDFDVNAVTGIVLESASATTHLYRADSHWRVAEMYGYYADFDRMAQFLRALAFVESAQVVHGGTDRLEDFGLTPETEKPWTRICLHTSAGTVLPVMVGDPWFPRPGAQGPPIAGGGRYIRVGDGPVLLVVANVYPLPAEPRNWIRRDLLHVDPAQVHTVAVNNTNSTYTLTVRGADEYELSDQSKTEELDRGAINRLRRSLQYLNCISVADPQKPSETLGLSSNSPTFRLTTTNGIVYSVTLGDKAPEGGYYARITVDLSPPPAPTEQAVRARLQQTASTETNLATGVTNLEERVRAELEQEKQRYDQMLAEARRTVAQVREQLADWVYIIPQYDYETFTLPRSRLIKPPEPKDQPHK